jgi:hypothetical protein
MSLPGMTQPQAEDDDKPQPLDDRLLGIAEGRADKSFIAARKRAEQRRALREGASPSLWTGDELIGKRQGKLDAMAAIAARWNWDVNHRLRLLDYDSNAHEARHDLALEVFGSGLAWPQSEQNELLDMFAEGRSADAGVMDLSGVIDPPRLLAVDGPPTYEGLFHLDYGPRGSAKTLLLIYRACVLATRGVHSILWEYEMSTDLMKMAVEDLGFDRDEINRYMHVINPEEPLSTGLVLRQLARFPEAKLLALDNVTEVVSLMPDASENAAQDVSRLLRIFRNLSHSRGVTTIALDHSGHQGGHARGSSVKGQITDVELEYTMRQSLTREQIGVVEVKCHKDRGTKLGAGSTRSYAVGDGNGALPVAQVDGDLPGVWTPRQQKLIEVLRAEHPNWLNTTPLLKLVGVTGGNAAKATQRELHQLADDKTAPVEREILNGNQFRWRFDSAVEQLADLRGELSAEDWEKEILRASKTGELTDEGKRGVAAALRASPDSPTFSEAWDRVAGREAIQFSVEAGRYVAASPKAQQASTEEADLAL